LADLADFENDGARAYRQEAEFAPDSPLEESGFEPLIPLAPSLNAPFMETLGPVATAR
jgi:hypothetical protein